jgi:hypothetical protein
LSLHHFYLFSGLAVFKANQRTEKNGPNNLNVVKNDVVLMNSAWQKIAYKGSSPHLVATAKGILVSSAVHAERRDIQQSLFLDETMTSSSGFCPPASFAF